MLHVYVEIKCMMFAIGRFLLFRHLDAFGLPCSLISGILPFHFVPGGLVGDQAFANTFQGANLLAHLWAFCHFLLKC